MTQYIDKSTLIAEIKRRMDENRGKQTLPQYFGMIEEDLNILSFLDTLEVKEISDEYNGFLGKELKIVDNEIARLEKLKVKEVDLEKEFDKCCENYIFDDECEVYTARHFFELGFKAQKGE